MPIGQLTPELVCELLLQAGLHFTQGQVRIQARDERWVVHLPDDRLAWFAASEAGRRLLMTERRVLRLLAAKCSFGAPRVLFEDPAGDFDVRAMVPGFSDPWQVFEQVCERADVATRLGTAVGAILVEQHTRIGSGDVAGWLPRHPSWPESRHWILERLVKVVDDAKLIADADALIKRYEALPIAQEDRVLVHTDLGFHNMGINLSTLTVHGVFDYEGAAWADRHHDFRYLVFDQDRDELFDAALAVYEPAVGHKIDRGRVFLYNAACAITFLAYRMGTAPDERSCGRTLAQDLRWSRHAIARGLRGP
jgi:Phosphotransferase enzyme family